MTAFVRGCYSRLVSAYCAQLKQNPWRTQALTSAALWCGEAARRQRKLQTARLGVERAFVACASPRDVRPLAIFDNCDAGSPRARRRRGAGDVVAQAIEQEPSAGAASGVEGTDVNRALLVTVYGGAFVGPLGHGWYELLERVTTRIWQAGSARCIAAKIAADTVVFGPIHVASASRASPPPLRAARCPLRCVRMALRTFPLGTCAFGRFRSRRPRPPQASLD